MFKEIDIGIEALTVGAVGALQFEVLEYRLKHEYGVELRIEHLPHKYARWLDGKADPRKLILTSSTLIVEDEKGRYVLLFENEWSIRWAEEKNTGLKLVDIGKQQDYQVV